MQVRVLFFGSLRDMTGRASESLRLPDGATLDDLLTHYRSTIPKLGEFLPSIALSVNHEYAKNNALLHDNDEVALLPPVSGGKQAEAVVAMGRARLVRSRIDGEKVRSELQHGEDGAVVVFDGVVRDNTRGRRTLYLNYEAYEDMALKQMEELAAEALKKYAIHDVRIVHRVGRLEIGESSVFIAVCSAHRAAAFDACRWIIDTLKRTVPVWKKEYFEDGAVWADGEPFPPEIKYSGQGGPASH